MSTLGSPYFGKPQHRQWCVLRPLGLELESLSRRLKILEERVTLLEPAQRGPDRAFSRRVSSFYDEPKISPHLSPKTGTPTCLLFLDWKMTVDKLENRALKIALQRLGVQRRYMDIIAGFCQDQSFTITGFNGDSVPPTPHTSIWQGCRLSLYLFIMLLIVLSQDVDTRFSQWVFLQVLGP